MEWTKIVIKELGPISHIEFSIKPITILIGKNCYGKSLLLNTLYLLSDSMPDFFKLGEDIFTKLNEPALQAYTAMENRELNEVSKLLTKMLHLNLRSLGDSLNDILTNRFKEFFDVNKVTDIFNGSIYIKSRGLSCSVKVDNENLKVDFNADEKIKVLVKKLDRRLDGKFSLILSLEEEELPAKEHIISDPTDIIMLIGAEILPYILMYLSPLWFGASNSFLLTDSRAGILRMTRAAVAHSLQYGRLLIPARESAFLSAYNKLADRFRGKGVLSDLKESFEKFLAELGLREIKVKMVGGYPDVFIEDIWGRKLPLEESPSGIREAISAAIALSVEGDGTEALFIEEIESHLHPKALKYLMSLIWDAIFKREKSPIYLIATTHNPIVLSKLNNLILKSHDNLYEYITIVYLRKVDGKIIGEGLEVDKEGFDESILSEIFVELLEEREATT